MVCGSGRLVMPYVTAEVDYESQLVGTGGGGWEWGSGVGLRGAAGT